MTTNGVAFKTTSIKFTSRASVKIGDSYYTFEATEERSIDNEKLSSELNEREQQIQDERIALWDTVNAEVDSQIEDTVEFLKKKR